MIIGLCYDLEDTYDIDSNASYKDFSFLSEVEYVQKSLRTLGHNVILINGLDMFVNHIFEYKQKCDIIFNMIEGYKSRNREGLLPALCEAFKIPYTGTDSFGLSLSLNKYHMNQIIKSFNINTPNAFLIDYPITDIKLLKDYSFKFPCVIKPNHEGSSMGIYLVESIGELIDKACYLSKLYEEQLIVEEYIKGAEMSIGIIGSSNDAHIYSCLQFVYNDGKDIDIFDYESKYKIEHQSITPRINDDTLKQICNQSLFIHKIMHFQDFSRIDWKVCNDKAYLIETTPLPSFAIESDFDIGSQVARESFEIVLDKILSSALRRWERY